MPDSFGAGSNGKFSVTLAQRDGFNPVITAAAASLVAQTESPVQTAPAAQTESAAQPARRPLSPPGMASAQVLGQWVRPNRQTYTMGGETYQGGKWIDITYGRPLMRGRDAFTGTGSDYGKSTIAQIPGGPNAPVWRAGANLSTRLKTEVPLVIGGMTVPPGEYSLFIDLKQPTEWTFIVSSYGAAAN